MDVADYVYDAYADDLSLTSGGEASDWFLDIDFGTAED